MSQYDQRQQHHHTQAQMANQQAQREEENRRLAQEQARQAFEARNNYAARMGMGDDGAGRSVFNSGPAGIYASPSETSHMRANHAQNETAFQNALNQYGQANANAGTARQSEANWMDRSGREEQYQQEFGQREREMQNRYGAENNKTNAMSQMAAGLGSGFGMQAGGQPSMPSVNLYDNGGKRIGGSFGPLGRSLLG